MQGKAARRWGETAAWQRAGRSSGNRERRGGTKNREMWQKRQHGESAKAPAGTGAIRQRVERRVAAGQIVRGRGGEGVNEE